jgi:hypothetical protein
MTTWLKTNLVAIIVAGLSLSGSILVAGRLVGQLEAVVEASARTEIKVDRLSDAVTQLRERTSALDERTRTRRIRDE